MKQGQIAKVKVTAQPLVAVRDVRASSHWYQTLLAANSLPEHEHRNAYDRIFCDGQLILQLHAWDEHEHPNLMNADAAPVGHGVLLWFEVSDFAAAVGRVRTLNAQILEGPYVNENSGQEEIWIRDLNGYVVVLAGPGGDATTNG